MKRPNSLTGSFANIQAFLDDTHGQITIGEIPVRSAVPRSPPKAKKVRVALGRRDNETISDYYSGSTRHWRTHWRTIPPSMRCSQKSSVVALASEAESPATVGVEAERAEPSATGQSRLKITVCRQTAEITRMLSGERKWEIRLPRTCPNGWPTQPASNL